jgi:uncharacterized membrane protein
MRFLFQGLFVALTIAGAALPFLTPGTWPWWDSSWIFVFFVAVYANLARASGLSAARFSSGIVVLAMAVILGLTGLTGWPCGPLRFTAHAGLSLGGAMPLALPLLAFALLTVSVQAAEAAFPGAGRTGLVLAATAGFILSVINGLRFFTWDRLWWVWNPEGGQDGNWRAVFGLVVLAAAAFAVSFAYPPDTRLRRNRWSPDAVVWILVNTLFLAANLAMFRI